jgi:hypothetical protein
MAPSDTIAAGEKERRCGTEGVGSAVGKTAKSTNEGVKGEKEGDELITVACLSDDGFDGLWR